MASRVAKGPPPPASAKTGASAAKEEKQANVKPVNRREFLFYIWGASMAMFLGQSGGMIIWFMLPRFREGEFGGIFRLGTIPEVGDDPQNEPSGKFFLSNTEEGLVAIYKVCTHLGCLYSWVDQNGRFECPCHGSKFTTAGIWIEGPAPRSLDRFAMTVVTNNGTFTTNEVGDPIPIDDPASVQEVQIDTGNRLKRPGRV